jgi:transcriptional regulator with XRE-family HTH domain
MRSVGARVRREREKAHLSLAQLAAAAGLTKAYVLKVESGDTNASLRVLAQLAQALQLTVADLVGGPSVRFDPDEAEPPASSLLIFADEAGLGPSEITTLNSIRWRAGEEPRTPERWRYIFNSLRLSRSIDAEHDETPADDAE